MNILITGGEGYLGSFIAKSLAPRYNVITLGKSELNITHKEKTLSTIEVLKPDFIIHCAALKDVDFCENHETEAYTVNTIGTLNVSSACSALDIPIIYISTNEIYDGRKNSPYSEADECNPLNVYGKTKLAGENLIRTLCKKFFIVRTSCVFGGENFYIKKNLMDFKFPMNNALEEIVSPTYIDDLCKAIDSMINSDLYGIYNCSNKNYCSKAQVLETLFSYSHIGNPLIKVKENKSLIAPRPKFTAFNTSLIKEAFNLDLPPWEDRLYEYVRKSAYN